jgi:hypothetical protein
MCEGKCASRSGPGSIKQRVWAKEENRCLDSVCAYRPATGLEAGRQTAALDYAKAVERTKGYEIWRCNLFRIGPARLTDSSSPERNTYWSSAGHLRGRCVRRAHSCRDSMRLRRLSGVRIDLQRYGFLAAALFVVALSMGSCGGTTAPEPEAGNRREVELSIQRAERTQTWSSWQQFCRAPWRGPQSQQPGAARLLLERSRVIKDARLFVVIENLGTAALGYGNNPKVDRLIRGSWHPQQFVRDGESIGFTLELVELKPRSTSSCVEIPTSDSWRRGLYRLRFSLQDKMHQGTSASTIEPVAYFRVIATSEQK